MYFGPDLAISQIGFEPLDTNPAWSGAIQVPDGMPTHHFAWLMVDGDLRAARSVRRTVLERHPRLHAATHQEIHIQDDRGCDYTLHGEAIAMAPVPAWPNAMLVDSVYRWRDAAGRTTHGSCQEIWFEEYQRAMSRR
jgi:hypothetical protein